jgi:hypothetical protein
MEQWPPADGPDDPPRSAHWVPAPVEPWGSLLFVCAVLVTVCSGLMAAHSAICWRAFAALPSDAPVAGAEPTGLSDLAPTLAGATVVVSWIGFAVSLVWGWARRHGRLGPRRPIPPALVAYIYGTYGLYLLTWVVVHELADTVGPTNEQNATAWSVAAISWTLLTVSWGVSTVLVPNYDRVIAPRREPPG